MILRYYAIHNADSAVLARPPIYQTRILYICSEENHAWFAVVADGQTKYKIFMLILQHFFSMLLLLHVHIIVYKHSTQFGLHMSAFILYTVKA